MERRAFLKGIAAFPAAAVPPAASPVRELIADHALVKAAAREADRVQDEIFNKPSRPPYASVSMSEVAPIFRSFMRGGSELDREDVKSLIDAQRYQIRMMAGMIAESEGGISAEYQARIERRLAEADVEQTRLEKLFDERQAIFDAWTASSGHGAADAEADRLWKTAFDLDDAIIGYRCKALQDVCAVAGHIRAEYGDEFSAEAANRFINALAGAIA